MKITFILSIYVASIFCLLHADIYYPKQTRPYKKIVIFFDLDKVVLNELSGIGKVWAALRAVPLKRSIPILVRQRKRLTKLVKEARYDGQKLKGLKANLDCILDAEPSLRPYRAKLIDKLNQVAPRSDMIRFLNALRAAGSPLIIATNNDYESLMIKMEKLNKKLYTKNNPLFVYDGCFCGGSCPELMESAAPDGIPAGFVYGGKDTDEYYSAFFNFVENALGCGKNETLFVYIDDLDKNIERARRVAAQEGVQFYAVHRNKPDKQIIKDMRMLFYSMSLYPLVNV